MMPITLAPETVIDLHLHTHHSDGTWTPEQLLDHLAAEHFGLAAIADHDRVETVPALLRLAAERRLPLLPAVEMSATWRGDLTDLLCYGFDPTQNELDALAQDLLRRQRANTRAVFERLLKQGLAFPSRSGEAPPYAETLAGLLEKPSTQQLHALVALLKRHGYGTGEVSAGKMVLEAGGQFITHAPAEVAAAAHRCGAVCLVAHPGRGDGFACFDVDGLDQFRQEVPIDGLEVYYPTHTPEQTALYQDYAQKHQLLTSAGSDSHGPEKKPIRYSAELSRSLLERVGALI